MEVYYPREVRTGQYFGLGVFMLQNMNIITLQLHKMSIVG